MSKDRSIASRKFVCDALFGVFNPFRFTGRVIVPRAFLVQTF
jgi:hypothetical protein